MYIRTFYIYIYIYIYICTYIYIYIIYIRTLHSNCIQFDGIQPFADQRQYRLIQWFDTNLHVGTYRFQGTCISPLSLGLLATYWSPSDSYRYGPRAPDHDRLWSQRRWTWWTRFYTVVFRRVRADKRSPCGQYKYHTSSFCTAITADDRILIPVAIRWYNAEHPWGNEMMCSAQDLLCLMFFMCWSYILDDV